MFGPPFRRTGSSALRAALPPCSFFCFSLPSRSRHASRRALRLSSDRSADRLGLRRPNLALRFETSRRTRTGWIATTFAGSAGVVRSAFTSCFSTLTVPPCRSINTTTPVGRNTHRCPLLKPVRSRTGPFLPMPFGGFPPVFVPGFGLYWRGWLWPALAESCAVTHPSAKG